MNKELLRQKQKQWRLHYKLNGPVIHRSEKVCQRCKQLKPIDDYPINRDRPDWHGSRCKPCNNAVKDEWRQRNPEKARALSYAQYERSKSKPNDERLKYSRKYYQTHKSVQAQRTKDWKEKNRKKFNAYMLRYHKEKLASNPSYAFAVKIRTKIRLLLSGHRKSAPTEQLLGCKLDEFKKHIELQWEPWMSWENYGWKGEWCIDHIVPVYAFNLDDPEQQRLCFHFSNMRPLCSKKNRNKWHKYEPANMEALKERVKLHDQNRIQTPIRLSP